MPIAKKSRVRSRPRRVVNLAFIFAPVSVRRERKVGEHGKASGAAQASRPAASGCSCLRSCSSPPSPSGSPGPGTRTSAEAPQHGTRCSGSPATSRGSGARPARLRASITPSSAGGTGNPTGSTFAALFPTLGPIPMIHLGTEGQSAPEAITPGGIAAGQGDGYLIALNRAIATWNKGIYVRPLAEMNNSANAWSGYLANGRPKDAAHSPATYRKAFARIYVILHGGSTSAVNAKLRQLGLPPVGDGELLSNPFPRLRIVWSPLASRRPSRRGQRGGALLPGARLRRRRRGIDLRRAPHRHGAVARSREAVPLFALAPEAVLGA